jgi:hypothetical protein
MKGIRGGVWLLVLPCLSFCSGAAEAIRISPYQGLPASYLTYFRGSLTLKSPIAFWMNFLSRKTTAFSAWF